MLLAAEESVAPRFESSSPRPGYDLAAVTEAEAAAPETGLTGDWNGARTNLEKRGITPYAVFATELMGNVAGGFGDGLTAPGLLDFGVEFDLEKLVGWKGGGFTLTAFAAYGDDGSAKFTGDFNVASNLFTDTDFNLFNIFLSQTFRDDLVYIKAGQIAVDDDFMGSETASYFLSSAFGSLPTESGNIGAPIFPLAAPGAMIRISPSETFSLHAGVYSGNAGPVNSSNHGFEWRTGGTTGWVTFVEADYSYACGTAKIGEYYDSGEFTDLRTAAMVNGVGAIYGIIDHRFIESDAGRPGLSAFARASIAPQEERVTVSHYYDAGVAIDSIFAEGDALGFAVSPSFKRPASPAWASFCISDTTKESKSSVTLRLWITVRLSSFSRILGG